MAEYPGPIELAREKLGDEFALSGCSMVSEADVAVKETLNNYAEYNGFIDSGFWTEAAQGIIVPRHPQHSLEKEVILNITEVRDLTFVGILKGFRKFSTKNIVGAWCLNFHDTIVPLDTPDVPATSELWIPTFAVKKIEPL